MFWTKLVAAAGFLSVLVNGQFDVSPCLVHRVDQVPCVFRSPSNTASPAQNEYGIYSTRIGNGPTCEIRRRNHQIRNVDTIGGDPRVKLIFSPGIELDPQQSYGNQVIVRYNLACPSSNDIAYFNITSIATEGETCLNPANQMLECVDYLRVYRSGGSAGVTESCGVDAGVNIEQLDAGNIEIVFRTSDTQRSAGFTGIVVCVSSTATTDVAGRRKRDLDGFTNRWKRRLNTLKTMKANKRGRFRRQDILIFEEIIIRFGAIVSFENRVITIRNSFGSMTRSIPDLRFLHTFDSEGIISEYRGTAADLNGDLIIFNGPGSLVIVGDHAYFTLFLFDPRGILPTNEIERRIINELSFSPFGLGLEEPDERLCDEIVNPPPINFAEIFSNVTEPTTSPPTTEPPECPLPANTDPVPCDFPDGVLLMAVNNLASSNAIIRTLAEVIIDCTDREQPGRIDELTTTPVPPTTDSTTSTLPPTTAMSSDLFVDCLGSLNEANRFSVQCQSNREGGVFVSSCFLDDGDFQTLANFCSYPDFIFPLIETRIAPGPHNLTIFFQDADNSMTFDAISFQVPLAINCISSTRQGITTFTCDSNLGTSAGIFATQCIVDGQIEESFCSFPTFMFDPSAYGEGVHTLDVLFIEEASQSEVSVLLTFIFIQI